MFSLRFSISFLFNSHKLFMFQLLVSLCGLLLITCYLSDLSNSSRHFSYSSDFAIVIHVLVVRPSSAVFIKTATYSQTSLGAFPYPLVQSVVGDRTDIRANFFIISLVSSLVYEYCYSLIPFSPTAFFYGVKTF